MCIHFGDQKSFDHGRRERAARTLDFHAPTLVIITCVTYVTYVTYTSEEGSKVRWRVWRRW